MFIVKVDKNIAQICRREPMTSGSSNAYLVQFYFSPEWDDLTKVAVFRTNETSADVILGKSNRCFIPWEVLAKPNTSIELGVYGTYRGDVILPTIWTRTDRILEGVVIGAEAVPPTPSLYEQLLEKLNELSDIEPLTTEELEVLLS